MRLLAIIPTLVLVCATLGACSSSAPPGVLPRDGVPPPPSLTGRAPRQTPPSTGPAQRGALGVPERVSTQRSAPVTFEPVRTGSGVGAGFRF